MVTQYDIEAFQKIETAINMKMKVYPTEENLVLVMLDRVADAVRLATKELKDSQLVGNKRSKLDNEHNDPDNSNLVVKKKRNFKRKRA